MMPPHRSIFLVGWWIVAACGVPVRVHAQEVSLPDSMSLNALMGMQVVTASKKSEAITAAPSVVTVLTAREIRRSGAQTVKELLERLPSCFFYTTARFPEGQLSIRGDIPSLSNNHSLFLIDGRPFRVTSDGPNEFPYYLTFPVSAIERIEFVRGPGSVLYGSNAFTGVMNIITKRAETFIPTATVSYGSANTFLSEVSGGGMIGEERLFGSVVYARSDGWGFGLTDTSGLRSSIPIATEDLGAFLRLETAPVQVSLFLARSRPRAMSGGAPVFQKPPPYERDVFRAYGDVTATFSLVPSVASTMSLTYNRGTLRTNAPVDSAQDDLYRGRAQSVIAEWTNSSTLGAGIQLLFGLTAADEYASALIPTFTVTNGHLAAFNIYRGKNGAPFASIPSDDHAFLTHDWFANLGTSVYAQASCRIADGFLLVGGAQANKIPKFDLDVVPRAGLIYDAPGSWFAKLLYGQAFRSPAATEKRITVPFVVGGSDELGPETISTTELQVGYAEDRFACSGVLFRSNIRNVITTTLRGELLPNELDGVATTPGVPFFLNRGTAEYSGIEFEGSFVPSRAFRIVASATYQAQQSNYRARIAVDTTVADLYGMPHLLAKLGAEFKGSAGVRVSLFDSFVGSYPPYATLRSLNPAPGGFHDISLTVTFDLNEALGLTGPSVEWTMAVRNLLDDEAFMPNTYDRILNSIPLSPGRTFRTGLSVRL